MNTLICHFVFFFFRLRYGQINTDWPLETFNNSAYTHLCVYTTMEINQFILNRPIILSDVQNIHVDLLIYSQVSGFRLHAEVTQSKRGYQSTTRV